MVRLLNTLRQIWNSDSVHPAVGYMRHVQWQIRRLSRGFPVDLTLSHSVVHVDSPVGVGALVNAMGKYDYNNMSFIAEVLTRFGGVFVDVGANIGTYTLVASEVPAARVISVEPHPATFAQLVENVKRNLRQNVVCINVALSDHLGSVCLTDRPDSSLNRVLQSEDQGCQSVTVPCRTMAALCGERGIVPDLVKIDVEGHERAVLDGFGGTATSCQAVLVEEGERPTVRDWMKDSGFSGPFFVHFRKRVLSRKRQARTEDPIFIRQSLVSRLRDINFDFTEQGVRERA